MKHFLLFTLFYTLTITLNSQTEYPPIIWSSGLSTNPGVNEEIGIEFFDIAAEPLSGSIFVAANCFAPTTFPNGQTIIPGAGGNNLLLIKYNGQGGIDWIKDLGWLGDLAQTVHICADGADGVFLSTNFSLPEYDFGNGVVATLNCTGGNCVNVFITRFNSAGTAVWTKTIASGENNSIQTRGLEFTSSGQLFISGNYYGLPLTFGPGFEYPNIFDNGLFIARYDANTGAIEKTNFAHSEFGPIESYHLAANNNGQAMIAGLFSQGLEFEDGLTIESPGNSNIGFAVGLDTDCKANWARTINSEDYFDLLGIDMDEAGNSYFAIDASTNLLVDNNEITSINTAYAGIVLKLSQNEASIPVIIPYQTDDYAILDVKLDHWGHIYTSGYYSDNLTIGAINLEIDGCVDALITGSSNEGNLQWARMVGGTGCEAIVNDYYAANLAVDALGFLHTTALYIEGFEEDGFSQEGTGGMVIKFYTSIVGTNEPQLIGELKLSPNPGNGDFNLELELMPLSPTHLSIHDLGGREVFRKEITQTQMAISTELPAGVYIASIQNGTRLDRQKLVVQH